MPYRNPADGPEPPPRVLRKFEAAPREPIEPGDDSGFGIFLLLLLVILFPTCAILMPGKVPAVHKPDACEASGRTWVSNGKPELQRCVGIRWDSPERALELQQQLDSK